MINVYSGATTVVDTITSRDGSNTVYDVAIFRSIYKQIRAAIGLMQTNNNISYLTIVA
jgi:hypothetical protein